MRIRRSSRSGDIPHPSVARIAGRQKRTTKARGGEAQADIAPLQPRGFRLSAPVAVSKPRFLSSPEAIVQFFVEIAIRRKKETAAADTVIVAAAVDTAAVAADTKKQLVKRLA